MPMMLNVSCSDITANHFLVLRSGASKKVRVDRMAFFNTQFLHATALFATLGLLPLLGGLHHSLPARAASGP